MLEEEILFFSEKREYYNFKKIRVISFENIKKLSEEYNITLMEVEKKALKAEVMPLCYVKNFETISFSHQLKLLESKLVLVGLGGIGGYVLENLARVGVGSIKGIDGDFFEESNLNRQILSSTKNLSFPKVSVAKKRV